MTHSHSFNLINHRALINTSIFWGGKVKSFIIARCKYDPRQNTALLNAVSGENYISAANRYLSREKLRYYNVYQGKRNLAFQ